MKYKLFFDGSCGPVNPGGNMGLGCYAEDENNRIIFQISKKIESSPNNTNNKSEYLSLIEGLKKLIELNLQQETIEVYGDSQLVIMQMKGLWKWKKGKYVETAFQCKMLRNKFSDIDFNWIPREENKSADILSR